MENGVKEGKKERGKRDKRNNGVCFPVYEYLPWNVKTKIEILLFTKSGIVFECFILRLRKSLY